MKYTLKFISTRTRRTVNRVFFFFYRDSVIKSCSCEVTQEGDTESPALFSDSIRDLIDSLESKINLWYLDDGNLGDDNRNVLKDLKKTVEAQKGWDSKLNPQNVNFFPWGHH